MRISSFLAIAVALPLTALAQTSDPNLGRNLSAGCTNCHGTTGKSVGGIPSIAGQPKEMMLNTLKEFKAGKRPATIMHQHAKGYTDAQLELIAAHFAAQK